MLSVFRNSRPARFVLAALSGVLVASAFPSAGLAWLSFVALAPLIVAAFHATSKRESFALGHLAMTIAWLINLPWVVHVMSTYGGLGVPTGIAIFVALAIILGAYGGLFTLFIRLVKPDERFTTWLVIPLIWAASEYGRTHLLSGFPWNLYGTSIAEYESLAVFSALAGPYALGALLVLSSTTLAWLLSASVSTRGKTTVAAVVVSLIGAITLGGAVVIDRRTESRKNGRWHTAAMVQPNISQQMRWDGQNLLTIFDRMTAMTEEASARGAEVVIWPESTVPLAFATTDFFRESIEAASRERRVDVILGSVAEDPDNPMKLWNAAYLVSNGETAGRYDKIRLVPFGEYVPLRKMLFFAEKLVRAVGDFQFGSNDRPLAGKVKYGPAICYEIVYPRIPARQVSNGAEVLVTITNDAWFGRSAAPAQHLLSARMRAIETDRYVLRAATTGISALIDPTGRVVAHLPLEQQGTVVGRFATRHSVTPYVRFGDWFAVAAVVATFVALVLRRKAPGNG